MQKIQIAKKKKGQYRTLYVPSQEEKLKLREILPTILEKALKICNLDICHGFFPNTSPVTNALQHRGYQYTTIFDLKDFFDSININHLANYFTFEELDLILVDGAPRQGLPTSPIVANIAAANMDNFILRFLGDSGVKYTRYADDLCFSYNNFEFESQLKIHIPEIIRIYCFKINKAKTRTMSSKNGRRIITGISIDNFIHPTRRVKRKLRASLHQHKMDKYKGLSEWCKLKRPRALVSQEIEEIIQEFPSLLKEWAKIQHTNLNFSLYNPNRGNDHAENRNQQS